VQAFQKGKGAVGAAVIDDENLQGSLEGTEHVIDLLTKDGEVVRLVIGRNYD
jgi:hypothetical protein